jgi:hypothetical protein
VEVNVARELVVGSTPVEVGVKVKSRGEGVSIPVKEEVGEEEGEKVTVAVGSGVRVTTGGVLEGVLVSLGEPEEVPPCPWRRVLVGEEEKDTALEGEEDDVRVAPMPPIEAVTGSADEVDILTPPTIKAGDSLDVGGEGLEDTLTVLVPIYIAPEDAVLRGDTLGEPVTKILAVGVTVTEGQLDVLGVPVLGLVPKGTVPVGTFPVEVGEGKDPLGVDVPPNATATITTPPLLLLLLLLFSPPLEPLPSEVGKKRVRMEGVERVEGEASDTVGSDDRDVGGLGEVEKERVNEGVRVTPSEEEVIVGDRVTT